MSDNLKKKIELILTVICFFSVGARIGCSKQNIKEEKMENYTISNNLDSLQDYFTIKLTDTTARWVLHPLGERSSHRVPGPVDYELVVYWENAAGAFHDDLLRLCSVIETDMNGVGIDEKTIKQFQLDQSDSIEQFANVFVIHGKVLDASPYLKNGFSSGCFIVFGKSILFQSNTF